MKPLGKYFIAAFAVVVIALGFFALKGPFIQWRVHRLAVTAEALLQRGDQSGAVLMARSVLQTDPRNIAACEVVARAAEEDRSPLALSWRQKLVELQPGRAAPLLDLARSAVSLGESEVAESALGQVQDAGRNTAAYHDTVAAWALSLKRYDAAEKEAALALAFDPRNRRLRLSLAALKLANGKPAEAASARADLETLRNIPEFRAEATRDLLADARHAGDTAASMRLAQDLDAAPDAQIGDHLLYLEELQMRASPDFELRLTALQGCAAGPSSVFAIMDWMTSRGMGARTIAWHRSLAPSKRKMPEPLAVAEACVAQQDWAALRELIHGTEWGDLEFLRFAYETRLFDEESNHVRGADFKDRWQQSVFSAGGNPNAASMLARLVQSWGWKPQAAELWWSLANRSIGQRPALAALYAMSLADKDTRELYRISRRIYEVEPTSPVARNNVAVFALLRREDLPVACKLAEENFRIAPGDPTIVSTYAFSLYVQGRAREAVPLMAGLPETALIDPSIAACNGVILCAAGQHEKARLSLELAKKQEERLFPEEVAMVDQALLQSGQP